MSDQIIINSFRVMASVGILDEERARLQPLVIDATVDVDGEKSGASDNLEDTLNYAALVEAIDAIVQERHHDLLEALADEIARASLTLDARVSRAEVVVTKVRPPIGFDVDSVAVRRSLSR